MRLFISVLFTGVLMAADWVSIDPDPMFNGWTRVPIKPTEQLVQPSQWSIAADRNVICDGSHDKGHEFLRYDRELANFVLHVEWRFKKLEGDQKYNSGVFVRTTEDGNKAWYQAQIGPPTNGGYFFYVDTTGKRTSLKSEMPSNPVKEPGEWNTYEITANGPKIVLAVNGVETSRFECDRLRGYIGLEAEYYRIEFRNIKLKELP